MREKVKNENKEWIIKLSRKDKIWECTECNKEFRGSIPVQCSCGATDKVFVEKEAEVVDTGRKEYVVKSNFIFCGSQIDKDSIISLIEKDKVTKSLLSRKLIVERKSKKKKGVK